jgi:hypothetical protein
MPPKRPPFSFPRRGKRLPIPKIGRTKFVTIFEEYFYWCLVALFVVVAVLAKAAGMSAYNAIVVGLWLAAFVWFARQAKQYLDHRADPEAKEPDQPEKKETPEYKPPKVMPKPAVPPVPGAKPKPMLVAKRPPLGPRRPGLPANWERPSGEKPKQ